VDRDTLRVTFKWANGVTSPPSYAEPAAAAKHALLRRWDHAGDAATFGGALQITEQLVTDTTGWIKLEDGVEIWFLKGGAYRAGDFWLIPARTATGDVEWPDELDANGDPKLDTDGNPVAALQGPHGPYHHFAPLLLSANVAGSNRRVTRDCRCAIRQLPCVTYQYAFGGQAIGGANL
jgi:hypothetical protein